MHFSLLTPIVVSLAFGSGGQAAVPTPESQFESLIREYNESLTRANDAIRAAKTEAQQKTVCSLYPTVDVFGPRFMALAKKHPKTSTACDALVWIVACSRQSIDVYPTRVVLMTEAMERLVQDHVDDVRVGRVCRDLTRYASPLRDQFLRSVHEKAANRDVRGFACYYLSRYLVTKSRSVAAARNFGPGERGNALQYRSDTYFEQLKTMEPAMLTLDAEALLEKTIKEYGDLRNPPGSRLNLAQLAEADLKALGMIGIGKTAPDIEGADVDGRLFKLERLSWEGCGTFVLRTLVWAVQGSVSAPTGSWRPDSKTGRLRLECE